MHHQNPVVPPESGVHPQNPVCTYSVQNGVEAKNLRMIKELNSNLSAWIQTRYEFTRKIGITYGIRQVGILSVLEYATLKDEISKKLKKIW